MGARDLAGTDPRSGPLLDSPGCAWIVATLFMERLSDSVNISFGTGAYIKPHECVIGEFILTYANDFKCFYSDVLNH